MDSIIYGVTLSSDSSFLYWSHPEELAGLDTDSYFIHAASELLDNVASPKKEEKTFS